MKVYVIKVTETANPDNKNFAGAVIVHYIGKGQKLLKTETICGKYGYDFDDTKYLLPSYGYSRLCDAKRSGMYKNPYDSKYWTCRAEIIQIDC